jgi:hypothetical protein
VTAPGPTPEIPSARRLLRSTLIAALVAAAILVTIVLPAEYGVDPTGIGRILGLTQMGETKAALAREAAGHEAEDAGEPPAADTSQRSPSSDSTTKSDTTQPSGGASR